MATLTDLARRIGQDMKARSLVGHRHAWGDVDGKPTSFPPSTHTHDDRYYTEAEVDQIVSEASGTRSTGLRDITTNYPEIVATRNGLCLSRVGNAVQVSLYSVRIPGASAGQHLSQFLPTGFRPLAGTLLMVPVLQGSYEVIRFRVTSAGQLTVYNHDGASLIYGSATFSTADPWPTTLPGVPA